MNSCHEEGVYDWNRSCRSRAGSVASIPARFRILNSNGVFETGELASVPGHPANQLVSLPWIDVIKDYPGGPVAFLVYDDHDADQCPHGTGSGKCKDGYQMCVITWNNSPAHSTLSRDGGGRSTHARIFRVPRNDDSNPCPLHGLSLEDVWWLDYLSWVANPREVPQVGEGRKLAEVGALGLIYTDQEAGIHCALHIGTQKGIRHSILSADNRDP
eukprot:gene23074-biopygen1996